MIIYRTCVQQLNIQWNASITHLDKNTFSKDILSFNCSWSESYAVNCSLLLQKIVMNAIKYIYSTMKYGNFLWFSIIYSSITFSHWKGVECIAPVLNRYINVCLYAAMGALYQACSWNLSIWPQAELPLAKSDVTSGSW